MKELFDNIVKTSSPELPEAEVIGKSREGREILAYCLGKGKCRVSLIGGCHADEPVGPRFLRHLVSYLASLSEDQALLEDYQWWIVPHLNPDGEFRNKDWYEDVDEEIDLLRYLRHVKRELPGDDVEFNFPRDIGDEGARPENRAVFEWWRKAGGAFSLHASLHGMSFAGGPWFLIESAWAERVESLKGVCRDEVIKKGYQLHDVQRNGEKGFYRLEKGFTTRPDSKAMREFFLEKEDTETADKFRPSSMECVRSLGGDPLTLVSEMPLFILPGIGETLGPPDPVAEQWRSKIGQWKEAITRDRSETEKVLVEAKDQGVSAMSIRDQMYFQWVFISAGLELVA